MPEFTLLTPEDVERGVDRAIDTAEAVVEELVEVPGDRTFDNTLRPLDRVGDILAHAFHDYCFMGYVHTDKEVRNAAKMSEEKIDKWASDLYFRDELYDAVQEFAATEEAVTLEGEEERFLEFIQRDLRRAGHELDPDTRERVQRLTQRVIELGVRFQQNIDEWDGFILATGDDLEGMPESWIDSLEFDDETRKYKVTIDYPDLIPFLQNSPRRDLREKLRYEFNTVAVEENRKLLEEALELRQQIAEAFGQPTWAHHRLEDRMAKTPEQVEDFYAGLSDKLKVRGTEEVAEISGLLEADTGDTVVQAWDWFYYDTQQRKKDYGVDNFEVAKYFPLPQVLDGMFELTSEMFGITFTEITEFDTWHDDVTFYAIGEAATGEEIASFYLDLFPREGKYGHAAEFPLILSRRLEDGSYQNPTCAMVANFTKPTKDSPSLLQHSEVETLFHEFGHVLHQNLGRTELARFSGTNTERDFVEAPSQIMENWIWDADVLRRFARHYETGDPIPDQLVDQLVAARDLNKGRFYLNQMTYGWWDQQIHGGPNRDLDDILVKGYEISLLPHHQGTFALSSFGHLMGGYDAAYYGYMWSQVFGDDMFSRFEKEGVTNPEVGMAYRQEVIGRGGSLNASEMLLNFLGRKPNNSAFLQKLGIPGTE